MESFSRLNVCRPRGWPGRTGWGRSCRTAGTCTDGRVAACGCEAVAPVRGFITEVFQQYGAYV